MDLDQKYDINDSTYHYDFNNIENSCIATSALQLITIWDARVHFMITRRDRCGYFPYAFRETFVFSVRMIFLLECNSRLFTTRKWLRLV